MATIEDYIALSDGASPTLNRIIHCLETVSNSFQSAGTVAGRMANAISDATTRWYPDLEIINAAADATVDHILMVGETAERMNVDVYAKQAGEAFTNAGKTIEHFTSNAVQSVQEIVHMNKICNELKIPSSFITDLHLVCSVTAKASKNITEIGEAAVKAAKDTTTLVNAARNLPGRIRSPVVGRDTDSGGTEGVGLIGRIKGGLSNVFGKPILANLAAGGMEKVMLLLSKLMVMSDQYGGQAKLNLVSGSQAQTAALNDQIYFSALRARGGYTEMVDAVSKIGLTAKDVFPDPRTIVPFVENIQKMFVISGTDIPQQKNALLQLTQALGSGVLQGDAYQSILDAAPPMKNILADFMHVPPEALDELASQGEITAEIVKNAILGATDEINVQFDSIPEKWSDILRQVETVGSQAFTPVFEQISTLANSPLVQQLVTGISIGMILAGELIAGVINNVRWLGSVAAEVGTYIGEWLGAGFTALGQLAEMVLPYIIGMLVAYAGIWLVVNGVMAAQAAIAGIVAAKQFICSAASAAWAMVTTGLAGAHAFLQLILGNYLVLFALIPALIIVIVGAFLGWRIATNGLRNTIADAFEFIVDVCQGAINFMIRRVNTLIEILNKAADSINSIFGSNIGKVSLMGEVEWQDFRKRGDSIRKGTFLTDTFGNSFEPFEKSNPEDYTQNLSQVTETPFIGDIANSTTQTADNTKGMCEAMDITEEDIKYMREAAEQEMINQYTTAEVKIELGGVSNNLYYDTDLDGVIDHITDRLTESMAAGAEAVHV